MSMRGRLLEENLELRAELEYQWSVNHQEHCTDDWPHEGRCHWPKPEILRGTEALPDPEQKAV